MRRPSLLHRDLEKPPDPGFVETLGGVEGEETGLEVLGEELPAIVAGDPVGELGQVVGSEAEEGHQRGQFPGQQGRPRGFDHRARWNLQVVAAKDRLGLGKSGLDLGGVADQGQHELGAGVVALGLELAGGRQQRLNLHAEDLGANQEQPDAPETQHGVLLGERPHPPQELGLARLQSPCRLLLLQLKKRGQELVQRGVEQPHGHRKAVHGLEDALEVLLLEGEELLEGRLFLGLVVGQNQGSHPAELLLIKEHVLGAHQADALGAELAGPAGVLGGVGVGPHPQRAYPVGPGQEAVEFLTRAALDQGDLADVHRPGGAVDADDVALFELTVGEVETLGFGVDP